MAAILWIARATGLVPGWCWAIAVAALAVLCLRLDAEAAKASADLDRYQLNIAKAVTAEHERTQAVERDLSKSVMEAQNALTQSRAADPGRVAALDGRLRDIARPLSCGPASGSGFAAPAGRGNGQPHPRLPSVAGADLVVLDAQARADLAEFAVSARGTGEALTQARLLLRKCWRGN